MAVVRNLMIRAGADFSKASKAMGSFQRDLNGFQNKISNSMKAIGAVLAMAGASIGMAAATKSAMEYESAVLQINRTMQTSAKIFQEWSKENASAYGMAQVEAMKYAGIFSNLISGFAKDTKQVQEYTTELLKAGAITASATGRTIEDTMDRIRSGMLGSTEAIEDLGINVNIAMIESTNAFKQFANGKSWSQLSFQTQQQIRLFAILEQSVAKYGDEVANSTAAKQAMFIASLKNVQLALGQAFLPIYNIILPVLTRFINAISTAINYVAQFSQAIFGKSTTSNIQNQASAINSEASAVDGLTKSLKKASKASKAVAGFDQVNLIGNSSGGSKDGEDEQTGAAGGMSLDSIDAGGFAQSTVEVSEKVQAMVDKVKSAYGTMSDFIKKHSDLITAALAGVGTAVAVAFGVAKWGSIVATLQKIGAVIAAMFSTTVLVIAAVALAIGAIVGAIVYFYKTNEQFKGFVDGIFKAIGNAAAWLWNDVLVPFGQWIVANAPIWFEKIGSALSWLWNKVLVPFGKFLATAFVVAWESVSAAIAWLIPNVFEPIGNTLLWLWNTVIVPLGKILIDILGAAFENVAKTALSFYENVLKPLGKFLADILEPTFEAVSAVVTFLWEKAFVPLAKGIMSVAKPALEFLVKTFEYIYYKVLKPVGGYISGSFNSIFNEVFKSIGGVIDGLKTTFIGLMNFITGVFTGDWKKAWDGVKDIFKGIFDSLYSIVKAPLNMVIDGINKMLEGLGKIKIDIPDWVPGIGGKEFGINIPKIPKLAVGTNYVQRDGLAFLHEGEAVVPKKYNPAADGTGNAEVVSMLKEVVQAVRSIREVKAVITQTEVGRASTGYINDQTRRGLKPLHL